MRGLTASELRVMEGIGQGDHCGGAYPGPIEDEIYRLHERGLVALPTCRRDPTHSHPVVTALGREAMALQRASETSA
jgi:hypothetical protein